MAKVFIELPEILEDNPRFIDTRFDLTDNTAGRKMYDEEHLDGAIYWDLENDLSDMSSPYGRHPMISKEKMTSLVQKAGLNVNDFIVIYDQGGAPFALRAYFLLDWAGFTNVYVSRDGFGELKGALPVSKSESDFTKTTTIPHWNNSKLLSMNDVRQVVAGITEGQLIDARSNVRYKGESEPIDPVAGHIPTAINFDWEQLKKEGKFLAQEELKEKLTDLAPQDKPVIAYCGSGVTAAPLYSCLKEAGYENVQLYLGSYSDWIRENEVETDNNRA
ncbi:thiosulfate/3-mercaptopyruvate sulfurtransferase [Psychrobacillus sp. OK028]|uniref:sulfurtransferase n=1 Tax=Psychrobacillus sp. OK028 TaxID=1884359 RepID=UPI00088C0931|nr:rhodanese-like domain-containing protein [Psychrobacillus sp. OK028]SDN03900.1 thiosulfate/3-mercaptopyruvate sulfurtransferase [Psychrobacillus sp. OK028]